MNIKKLQDMIYEGANIYAIKLPDGCELKIASVEYLSGKNRAFVYVSPECYVESALWRIDNIKDKEEEE